MYRTKSEIHIYTQPHSVRRSVEIIIIRGTRITTLKIASERFLQVGMLGSAYSQLYSRWSAVDFPVSPPFIGVGIALILFLTGTPIAGMVLELP